MLANEFVPDIGILVFELLARKDEDIGIDPRTAYNFGKNRSNIQMALADAYVIWVSFSMMRN